MGKDTLVISCGYCQLRIKEDNDKKKRCKCSFVMFCSKECRRKSPHFKNCEGGDGSVFNMNLVEQVTGAINLERLPRNITDGVNQGLMTIENKTFEELLDMEDNPTACWRVAVALMNNTQRNQSCPIFCTLPKEYSQKTYLERYQLAITWLRKAADRRHPLATTSLGKNLVELKYELDSDEREGMKFLAIASKMGNPIARDDLMKHSRFVQSIKRLSDNIRDTNERREIYFQLKMYLATELGDFVLSRINNMNLDSFNIFCKNLDLNEDGVGIAEIRRFIEVVKEVKPSHRPH